MNKVLFVLACVCLFSCQSREEKIAALIRDEMFKTLYDFESYEPIETSKLDSAYTTIYQDSTIKAHAILILATMEAADEWVKECEEHVRTIEIWGDSYTARARNKVNEAKEEISKTITILEKSVELVKESQKIIKEESENFIPTFIGWSVIHEFRCKTKGGNFDLRKFEYIFTPQLDKILYTIDLESKSEKELKSKIDEALEESI